MNDNTHSVEIGGTSFNVARSSAPQDNSAGVRTVDAVIENGMARPASTPLRRWERSIAGLPTLPEGLNMAEARIRAEDPKDFANVNARAVRMSNSGRVYREGKGTPENALPLTHSALQHALSYLDSPRGATGVLEYLTPDARSVAFNDIAKRATRDDAEGLVMRTIMSNGQRVIRAVTSDRHSGAAGDDMAIIRTLRAEISADALIRVTRSWDRSDFEIIMPTRKMDVRRGDTVYAKLHLSNSETKGGSLECFGGIHRLTCDNGMVGAVDDAAIGFAIRHVGGNVERKIRVALQVAARSIEDFARSFGEAYEIAIPQGWTRSDTLERIGKAFPGLGGDLLKTADRVWDADGVLSAGSTLAGTANALTRAAQDFNMETALEAERAAGRLVLTGWSAVGGSAARH